MMSAMDSDAFVSQADRERLNLSRGLPAEPVYVACSGGGDEQQGLVVRGALHLTTGRWNFDDIFWIGLPDGSKLRVTGWNVDVEIIGADEPMA